MPHKCLRCGKIYSDEEIFTLKQCTQCGGRFFLWAKTNEELLKKEDLRTPEEKALGVAGEVEVRRIGDVVIVKKIKSREEVEKEEIKMKEGTERIEEEKKEIEKPLQTEGFSPWKKYFMPEIHLQTSEEREIEKNKQKIESIIEKKGIKDIKRQETTEIKPMETNLKSKKEEEKIEEIEEKHRPLTEEEWLERIFKDKIEGVVSMDIETLRILSTGKYEIDVPGLMGDKPVIATLREGTYYIDLRSAIEKFQKKKKNYDAN